ncbi:MAG: hypothetical protein ACTSWP_01225 [Candidatus Freyarchaeota archaeon]|nr:hypothetical protein [Candidatus Freyrarchaeum guaymaensis]
MVKIFMVEEGELTPVDKPVFSRGDTYVVDAGDKIWIWIGSKSTVDEKFAGALLSDLIDKERRGRPDVETVEEGKETKEFLAAVKGMRIVDKDLAKSILKKVGVEKHEPVMYRISGEEYEALEDIKFVQVPLSKEELNSEDVFLIDTWDKIYIWQGKKASIRERVAGGRIARAFDAERAGVQKEIFVEEGEEPEELKKILDL